ncbi:sensor histidine kinase [Streptomyces beijiangensis]|uniref:histidine kinase n=1 Tax=Streptomyces beijiangensis TaxID=163361 RepID=A0A939FD38_9ACTN|nr:histidine kinase [Streptomyces beijiangensis]MBO0516412.1 two-component sensor histidine kinase [Streptomyces beijiangensis]
MTVRPWLRAHWVAVDVTIAVLFALLDTATTLIGASWWPERPGPLAWTLLGVQALACLSLAFRRRAPLTVVAVLGLFTLAVTLLISPAAALTPEHPGNIWAPLATALAAYGPIFYGKDRRTACLALALFTVIAARAWQPSLTSIGIGVSRTAVGPLLALYSDARRRLVCALTERAERAERERHLLAERARTEERARLAGEMHDVVTHRVSLMVLQAGALRMTAPDETTRQAAEELRAAGCQALEELRDLVGILRTAPEGDATPSVAGLAALAAESAAVGTPVELVEEGDRAFASPVVGRIAYRTVREALTNVRKHAPGSRVMVRVAYDENRLRLTVRNTPPTGRANSGLVSTGSGLGIAGLRRRIGIVDGTLSAGPTPDGGFSVEATLPAYIPTAMAEAAVRS